MKKLFRVNSSIIAVFLCVAPFIFLILGSILVFISLFHKKDDVIAFILGNVFIGLSLIILVLFMLADFSRKEQEIQV